LIFIISSQILVCVRVDFDHDNLDVGHLKGVVQNFIGLAIITT